MVILRSFQSLFVILVFPILDNKRILLLITLLDMRDMLVTRYVSGYSVWIKKVPPHLNVIILVNIAPLS